MLHREGNRSLILFFILFLIISAISYSFLGMYGCMIALPFWVLYGFMIWFFRNPKRGMETQENDVVAPVDGKVVVIQEVFEKEYLKQNCIQVSIFMSPLNVHVCRYPVNGKVIFTKYHPGKFLVAWHEKSSELNERTTVVTETADKTQVLFRQIAGAVARRIVLYAKENNHAVAGNEYGFIKFGSRVDLFLPLHSKITVKVGDITKGGEQIIAKL